MSEKTVTYRVFLDDATMPPMYGIQTAEDVRAGRISTDYQEVSRLAQMCTSAALSPLHLWDVVEDFRRA